MERMSIENQKGVLYKEHIQRYNFIKPLLSGQVLDIACGVGYGSEVIADAVDQYLGIDFSEDAIKDAKKYYESDKKVIFQQGDIQNIKIEENSFDNVISFETLEHLHEPDKALQEIRRVLKNDGLFVGSVPSKEYDDICENVYGKNPYHVTRFSIERLQEILASQFQYTELFVNELIICNSFRSVADLSATTITTSMEKSSDNTVYGSFIFIACNDKERFFEAKKQMKDYLFSLMRLVEYDKEKEVPLRKTISDQEKIIHERDQYIQELLQERQEIIENYEQKMAEAIQAMKSQDKLVEERDRYIKELERKLNG